MERDEEKEGPRPSARREGKLPLAPKGLPVGEKTKTVGNWADNPGAVPKVRGDAGARRCPPDRLQARGGRGARGFWCETGADPPVAGETDNPELSSEAFFSSCKGCGKQDFSPGGSGSCAFVQTGNGAGRLMNRTCQSFIVGRSGLSNYGHCMVQYSTLYAAHGGKKKLWLKHVLLPWIVHYCGCRFSSRDASIPDLDVVDPVFTDQEHGSCVFGEQ